MKKMVSDKAKQLQILHTQHSELIYEIQKRLESTQCEDDILNEGWIWADVKSVDEIKKSAPTEMKGRELTNWQNPSEK